LLYAKEARAYSLWTLAIVASSASLLWAMRRSRSNVKPSIKNTLPWLSYIFWASVGVYSQTLFGFVLLAHLIYVGIQGWQEEKRFLGVPSVIWHYLSPGWCIF
jgi:uncharacterized membrane protein